jgi:hypothetical protein
MTTIHEKKEMKILNYYNEYTSNKLYLCFSHIRFLGIETISSNQFFRFELDNGNQFRRNVNDGYYEQITDDNYSDEEIKKIVFKDIKDSDNIIMQ